MGKRIKNSLLWLALIGIVFPFFSCQDEQRDDTTEFGLAISFPEELNPEALDGRLLLMLTSNDSQEPRFQVTNGPDAIPIFGRDVDGLKPGEAAVIDADAFGFPIQNITEIPAGEYWVQALLHVYETFHRADGKTVNLPMDRGEGQKWNRAPGNLYSTPELVRINPSKNNMIDITLDQKIPPFPDRKDTQYIKHIRIQSKLLTEFWGRPMHLEAIILLPEGFDEHPQARYPLMIYHGHHHRTFYTPVGFLETPPEEVSAGSSDRQNRRYGSEYQRIYDEYSYAFYKDWTGPDFPRFILVTIQHANPYFDDSYAVNSANLGPYGDAITYELIPHIEEKYRGIGEGWARVLYGGSTGGWEALGVQIFYPDEYNGCWASCPDPIDFRAYQLVNIYEDENAYFMDSQWKRTEIPETRSTLGDIRATMAEANHLELVLGTKARSGGQWDIWQAVFGPVGDDGYVMPIWDKKTGKIDHSVAEYWRENYDLRHILERDWATLGPKLVGKIHIYVGDMDTAYLNNAVYLMEAFLENTKDPYYSGTVEYGDRFGHCWSGDHDNPNSISRLTYNQRFAPKMLDHILKTAPPNADVTSWRY
jgi:hypothetical protein